MLFRSIIIIDFIDMKLQEDKELVVQQLDSELKKDRTKNNIVHFTDLGLVEMTRKRVGRQLSYFYEEDCPHCSGTGKIKSAEAIIEDIIRDFKMVAEDTDIQEISIVSSKRVIVKLKELYRGIMIEYLKARGKKLTFSAENINNIMGYDIYLKK